MEEYKEDFVELLENNGEAKIKINNKLLNSVTEYEIERKTDVVDITVTLSISPSSFKTLKEDNT